MATPDEIRAFAAQYGPMAAQQAARLNTTPENVLSQWALETGYGKSIIPGTNNLGNIKQTGAGGVAATDNQLGTTDRYRAYDSPAAGAAGYGDLLARRYPGVSGTQTPQQFAQAVQAGGYAEDPRYAEKLGGVANTLQRYASNVLGAMTGSGSAMAGELTPAQRAYSNAINGPTPPPGARAGAQRGGQRGQQPADPTADIFAPPPWAARNAGSSSSGQQGGDPTADIFAAPAWAAQAGAGGSGNAPAAPAQGPAAPAAPAARNGSTPPAATTSGFGAIGDWLTTKAHDAYNSLSNAGMVQAGLADQIDPATLPATPSLTQAPPAAPQDRGFLGDAANAFVHHAETPLLGLGQKGMALASAVSPIYGKDVAANTQQGMQQLNDMLTKRENFYQADQENGAGTLLGALGGDLAPGLLMGPLGGGLTGAMMTGGANALTQPVLNAQGAGDVGTGSAKQAAIGAALGGAGYGVQKGVGWLAGQAKDTTGGILDALRKRNAIGTDTGQQEAAQDFLAGKLAPGASTDAAQTVARAQGIAPNLAPENMGPQLPGVPNAPLIVPESPIPGVQRSMAERTLNPDIAQLHRTVRDSVPAPFTELETANQTARNAFFEGLTGNEQTLQNAIDTRTNATTALYNQARDAVVPVDDQMQAILATPSGRRALATAQSNWADSPVTRNLPFFGGTEDNPTITGQALQHIKFALDDLSDNALSSPNASTRNAAGSLRQEFMGWAGDNNPIYRQANQTFADLSQPVNEQTYLQNLGISATDKNSNVQLGKVKTLLDKITRDQANAGPTHPVNSISPDTLTGLHNLYDDLNISDTAFNLGKAKGSETAQKGISNYMLANANLPARAAVASLGQAGKTIGTGVGSVFGPVGTAAGIGLGSMLDARTAESVAANQQGLLNTLAGTLTSPNANTIAGITRQATQRGATQAATQRAAAAAAAANSPATRAQLSKLGLLGALTAGRAVGSGSGSGQ